MRPLQAQPPHHPGEGKHGDDFGDLPQGHPCGGPLQPERVQVRGRVGVKGRDRDGEKGCGEEDGAVFGVLEQAEGVPAEALAEGEALGIRRRGRARKVERERGDEQPDARADEARDDRGIRVQDAHAPAADHPPKRTEGADGAEFALRIAQPHQHDRARHAPRRRGTERVKLDRREHDPRTRPAGDGPRRQAHRARRGKGEPAQDNHRGKMPVGQRAKDQRRDESRDRRGGKGVGLDRREPVAIEHRAEGHEPRAHRGGLDE